MPGSRFERLLDLQRDLPGAVQRSALRQLRLDEEGALVLRRQEARSGVRPPTVTMPEADDGEQHEAEHRDPDQPRDHRGIAVPHLVDAARDIAHDAALRPVMRLQHDAAERGRERQRVDRREQHRDADGDRELPEQRAGDARDEGERHEHREQDQRDGDDRRGDRRPSPSWSPPPATAPGWSSIVASTASTTTIASSTTMPMASTMPSSEIVLAE